MIYLLVEDTQIMNGFYSIILDEIMISLSQKAQIIFWRSPGFEFNTKGLPIFNFKPTYLSRPCNYRHCSGDHVVLQSTIEIHLLKTSTEREEFLNLIKSSFGTRITLNEANKIDYRGVSVGRSITSYLVRMDALIASQRVLTKSIFVQFLHRVCISVDSQIAIYNKFPISASFFSESVYLSAAFNEVSLQYNVPSLHFLRAEGPISIQPRMFNKDNSIHSPVALANVNALFRDYLLFDNYKDTIGATTVGIENEVPLLNPSASATGVISNIICQECGAEYITETTSLYRYSESGAYTLNLYLHATTDGAYFYGDSGFPLPIDFYKRVISDVNHTHNRINIDSWPTVLIRPHPNMFCSLNSHYSSYHQKTIIEYKVFRHHLVELIKYILSFGHFRVGVVDPSVSVDHMLKLPRSFSVSHHGSLLYDCLDKDLPFIASSVSFLDLLPNSLFNGLFINNSLNPEESQLSLHKFLTKNLSYLKNSSNSLFNSRKTCRELSKIFSCYNTDYRKNLLNKVNRTPFSKSVYSLDVSIFNEGISWDSISAREEIPEINEMLDYAVPLCRRLLD